MSVVPAEYRLDGIYRQRQDGFFMQRVKLAAGVISASQARVVAATAKRFGRGSIHLTSRGNMEIHWLTETDLPAVKKMLATVGLTSRGSCGGAVRGITCSSQGDVNFPLIERLAHRLQRHFTGNPRFERLPKKFKIGIEADVSSRRHLIQDVGLVLTENSDGVPRFDIYVAGGLGREPQPGFLLEAAVYENRVIPMLEAIARVYAANTPAGKRLKHLLREIGEERFRQLLALESGSTEELPPVVTLSENMSGTAGTGRVVARIPAGDLSSQQLAVIADFADGWSDSVLMVTVDQDIAFHLANQQNFDKATKELEHAGFYTSAVNFRVCPGNGTCLAGLSPTQEIAALLLNNIGSGGRSLTWAISGCPNSCTQPQLADVGIVSSSLVKNDAGERTPRFDLYRSGAEPFAAKAEVSLSLEQLNAKIKEID